MGVVAAAALGLIVGGAFWWTDRQHYEPTDNAFVQADTAPVSALIAGRVVDVLVGDNQRVAPGQVLVRLDPVDPQNRLGRAQADRAGAVAQVPGVADKAALEQSMIAERQARLASAEADAAR